uniref:Uncharacterized protein n=1 Tax=Glossina palpalis gambiensis TaxID=67801 RepID=A0A1B0C6D0_9MUSC
MDHFLDTSEWIVSYDDEEIKFEGIGKVLWDIETTDRVTVKYRHRPFTVDVEAVVNTEGRHKFDLIMMSTIV